MPGQEMPKNLSNWALGISGILLSAVIAWVGKSVTHDIENLQKRVLRAEQNMSNELHNASKNMWTRREQDQFDDDKNPLIRVREFDSHVKRCEAEKKNLQREMNHRFESMNDRILEVIEDIRRIEDRQQLYEMNGSGVTKSLNYAYVE